VTRAQLVALTLIAAVTVGAAFAYGVLRLYA
jgi:hypothetical protein